MIRSHVSQRESPWREERGPGSRLVVLRRRGFLRCNTRTGKRYGNAQERSGTNEIDSGGLASINGSHGTVHAPTASTTTRRRDEIPGATSRRCHVRSEWPSSGSVTRRARGGLQGATTLAGWWRRRPPAAVGRDTDPESQAALERSAACDSGSVSRPPREARRQQPRGPGVNSSSSCRVVVSSRRRAMRVSATPWS